MDSPSGWSPGLVHGFLDDDLPAVAAVTSRACRMGTPEEIIVPSVRGEAGDRDFLIICPGGHAQDVRVEHALAWLD